MDSSDTDKQRDGKIPSNFEPASKARQRSGNLGRRVIRSHCCNGTQCKFSHVGADFVDRFSMDIPSIPKDTPIISIRVFAPLFVGGVEKEVGVITRLDRIGIGTIHCRDPSSRPAGRLMKLRDERCRRKLCALLAGFLDRLERG